MMRKKSFRHLNEGDVATALELLRYWNGKLTWDKFIIAIESQVGATFSKTALTNREEIQQAYTSAKARLRKGRQVQHGDVNLGRALERIAKLKNEVEVLQEKNHALLEQFRRWHYNARRKGLTDADLETPLPKLRR